MADPNVSQDLMINGAQRSVLALRAIEALAESDNNPDVTWAQSFESDRAAADLLIRASGVESEYMQGFMAVIAEYLRMCNTGGVPNLNVWKPVATMTPAELADYRSSRQEVD